MTINSKLNHSHTFILIISHTEFEISPYHVAVLTLRGSIPVIELHALQGAMAAHATEAVGVEEFIHGPHSWLSAG